MRSNTRKLPLTFALLAGVALTLAACSGTSMPTDDATMDGVATADAASTADATGAPASEAADSSAAAVPAPQTLPDALENADGLQTVAEALKVTGLAATTFNGQASYTLLAPEDDAFVSLGSARKALFAAGDHSELAVLIKNHLLPGRIAPADLGAAIDASPDGKITISTLGGDMLTFTRTRGGTTAPSAVIVTAPDGSQATLNGDAVSGGRSIAIPITGMLGKVVAAP